MGPVEDPIAWAKVERIAGRKLRQGTGRSGLVYHVVQGEQWRVWVETPRTRMEIGSARMQDHALALAALWEHGVSSGRIDMS